MDIEAAKIVFLKYFGNHGHMNMDGVYGEYRLCKISPEMEGRWGVELADGIFDIERLSDLKVGDRVHSMLSALRKFGDKRHIQHVLSLVYNQFYLEFFFSVTILEDVYDALMDPKSNLRDNNDDLLKFLLNTCDKMLENPVSISPSPGIDPIYILGEPLTDKMVIDRLLGLKKALVAKSDE